MAKKKELPKTRPGTTIESRENQMISRAMDLAEQRLINGTASAQEVVHFLKLGSTKERAERKLIDSQIALASAKVKAIESSERIEKIYEDAMRAMQHYSGKSVDE